jgi:hypothetical protein
MFPYMMILLAVRDVAALQKGTTLCLNKGEHFM